MGKPLPSLLPVPFNYPKRCETEFPFLSFFFIKKKYCSSQPGGPVGAELSAGALQRARQRHLVKKMKEVCGNIALESCHSVKKMNEMCLNIALESCHLVKKMNEMCVNIALESGSR
jgi:hypothetical protein